MQEISTLFLWAGINLVWSLVLTFCTARYCWLYHLWKSQFYKRERWLAEQERKQRQIL